MAKNDEKKQPGAGETPPPAAVQQSEAVEATIRSLHDQLGEAVEQLAGLAQRLDALEAKVAEIGEPVAAVLDTATEVQIEFDPAWLEGLTYKGSVEVKAEAGQNGRKVKRYKSEERPADPHDVLSYRVDGGMVTIILADGSKHVVEQ